MARDPGRPAEYHPLLQFELRTRLEGGPLRVPGQALASLADLNRRHCLVLVHGFNNTDGEAAIAYLGFRRRQDEIFQPPNADAFEHVFGDTFWPGDADWWWIFDKLDFLIYPAAVGTALTSAEQLADLLLQMPSLLRVDFVAHSLGCRVVLETVRLLHEHSALPIGRICLMAAAVPSEFLEYPERYYDLLGAVEQTGTEVRVLHSMSDLVLHLAFPPGQALAGEASDRALGRFGPTPGMPGMGGALTGREISGAAHGDYWGHSGTPPSVDATLEAGTFLRLGDCERDVSASRSTQVAIPELPDRDVGGERVVGTTRAVG
jgi:hypothetical protein